MKQHGKAGSVALLLVVLACGRTGVAPARGASPDLDAGGSDAGRADATMGAEAGSVRPTDDGGVPDVTQDEADAADAAPDEPDAKPLPPPTNHRPVATPCSKTRPPSEPPEGDAAAAVFCGSDSECPPIDGGTNGRCMTFPAENGMCTYDECAVDTDCAAGGVCECGPAYAGQGRFPNLCIGGGNCAVDGDCGNGGFCSPAYGPCGSQGTEQAGVGPPMLVGYFCHTSYDECTNDDQCPTGQFDAMGYCGWDYLHALWKCMVVDLGACTG